MNQKGIVCRRFCLELEPRMENANSPPEDRSNADMKRDDTEKNETKKTKTKTNIKILEGAKEGWKFMKMIQPMYSQH